jgi:hypothetical protein
MKYEYGTLVEWHRQGKPEILGWRGGGDLRHCNFFTTDRTSTCTQEQSPYLSGESSATNRLDHDTICELTSDIKIPTIQPADEGMNMDRRRLAILSEETTQNNL